eukprot:4799456-Prymnesium_polylepis.1
MGGPVPKPYLSSLRGRTGGLGGGARALGNLSVLSEAGERPPVHARRGARVEAETPGQEGRPPSR